MEISVVIVNYNGGDKLSHCVESCLREGIVEEDIFVVDNGSSDLSLAILRSKFSSINILMNGCNAGFARAVNAGIKLVYSEFVLILNNDARLLPGAVTALLRCAEDHPNAAFISSRLLDSNGRPQNVVADFPFWWKDLVPRFLQKLWQSFDPKMASINVPAKVPSIIGAAFLVRRNVLPKIGLLDERFFFYLEETEWCFRAHQLGYSVIFCPESLVEHDLGGTANRYRAMARIEFHRSRILYSQKVEGPAASRILTILLFLSSIINFFSNSLLVIFTIFLSRKARRKAAMYGSLFLWHLLGRPESWGLPGKCQRKI